MTEAAQEPVSPDDLILDFETFGDPNHLDSEQKQYITKRGGVGRKPVDEDDDPLKTLALHPLTARIITASLYNPDTGKGLVYFRGKSSNVWKESVVVGTDVGEFTFLSVPGDSAPYFFAEGEIIRKTWDAIKQTVDNGGRIVTWNGREFDAPFLQVRSLFHGIHPTVDLLGNRFDINNPHVDVADLLTGYGAIPRLSLDCTMRAMGRTSPKSDNMNGASVHDAYVKGEFENIARYCCRDTVSLGSLWRYHVRRDLFDPMKALKNKRKR